MKKEIFMTLVAVGLVAGLSANQPSAVAPAQSSQQEKGAVTLSADELAFAAKLSDQNRKVFSTQFSAEQRKAAMVASCATGSCAVGQKTAMAPNDAVLKVMKDNSAVVVEKQEASAVAKPAAVQVK